MRITSGRATMNKSVPNNHHTKKLSPFFCAIAPVMTPNSIPKNRITKMYCISSINRHYPWSLGGRLLVEILELRTTARFALRLLLLRFQISDAFLKVGIFLREALVGFLETGNLNLIWRHCFSILADELWSYAHIFNRVNPQLRLGCPLDLIGRALF